MKSYGITVSAKKNRSEKTGLPPGTLLHVGEKRGDKTRITVLRYNDSSAREEVFSSPEESIFHTTDNETHWIHVEGVQNAALVDAVGTRFGLHPLMLEDIMHTEQRVKIEDYGDHIYLVLRIITISSEGTIIDEQLSIVLTRNTVITFTDRPDSDFFRPLRERVHAGRGRIRRQGADYLFYVITDFVVDQYFPVLDYMEDTMHRMETHFAANSYARVFQEITEFNRKVLDLTRWTRPAGEIVTQLRDMQSDLVDEHVLLYFRDVHDHALRITGTLEMFKDSVASLFNMYMSLMSHKMNEIMKVLTVMATIFIPLTFIVGLYGMNFKYMPGLESPWGFHVITVVMSLLVAIMVILFKRRNIL